MNRVAALVLVALAAGCPTPLPPVDAGVEEDAGPEAVPYTCHIEGACDRGGLGQTPFTVDAYVCAHGAVEADQATDPDAVCEQTCGTAIVVTCQDSCSQGIDPGVPAPSCDS